ncbi:hypothetical protein F4775DRAFT_589652 [Biscogniauxia sp. FL1348]|nr:hypothetical protein F4775DRAFT_589652 [Biscogniauxia sp. FL1348]
MTRLGTTDRGQARAADNHARIECLVMEDVDMKYIYIDAARDPVILLDLDGGYNQNHMSRDWWFSHYTFCTIRSYSDAGRLINNALYVNPQSPKDFLLDVIGGLEPVDQLPAAEDPVSPRSASFSGRSRSRVSDGESTGVRDFEIAIESYVGAKRLVELSVRPLKYMKNPSTMKSYLLECGRKFESYTGTQFKHYHGVAIAHDKRVHISAHILLDDKSYCRSRNITLTPMRKIMRVPNQVTARQGLTKNTLYQLPEDDAMITALTLRGICLSHGLPAQLVVASIADIQERRTAATARPRRTRGQDKEFVCVLSGPLGVGKTTTAVTLSGSAQRPLYRIPGRPLDTFSLDGDDYLSKALRELLLRALDRQQRDASIVFLTTTTRTIKLDGGRLLLRAPCQEVKLAYPDEPARLQLWQKALRGCAGAGSAAGAGARLPLQRVADRRACAADGGGMDGYPGRLAHLDEGARAAANPQRLGTKGRGPVR